MVETLHATEFQRTLASSVISSGRPVTFLLGSALSLPREPRRGVPGASAMRALVLDEMRRVDPSACFSDETSYQDAFAQLVSSLGPDAPNRVIQRAVLMARWRDAIGDSFSEFWQFAHSTGYHQRLLQIADDHDGWIISEGTAAVARLCSLYPVGFGGTLLTTNFDPLVEVALAQIEAPYFASALHADGSFGHVAGSGTHVVHLHGHWLASDTLHIGRQLTAPRPQTRHSIRRLIERTTVVVLGYGGWEDVFTDAIRDVSNDSASTPDMVWCFHESEVNQITASQKHVLELLQVLYRRGRVRYVAGVEIGSFLRETLRACQEVKLAEKRSIVLEHFRSSVWKSLFDRGSESPGDVIKRLCDFGGELLTLRSTFAALAFAEQRGGLTLESVRDLVAVYRGKLHECKLSIGEWQQLECQRIAAVSECERSGTDLDMAAMNAVLAAECYLAVGDFDGLGVLVFCARAWHAIWRVAKQDQYVFWQQVVDNVIDTVDAH